MKIGPVNGIVLIGGGDILFEIGSWAKELNIEIRVLTSKRHADEVLSNLQTLRSSLVMNKINHLEIEDINSLEVTEFLKGFNGNCLYMSLSAAWIFKEQTIQSVFSGQLLNVHGTRLPTNRGGGGFSWQIMMGNRFGFSLIHKIDAGIDTGNIIEFEEYLYPSNCRIPRDFETINKLKTIDFLKSFIRRVKETQVIFEEVKQTEYLSTYWPRLNTKINGWINWHWPALEIERFILAFDDPYAGAQTFLNDRKVHIKSVYLSPQDAGFHPYQAGLIYRVSKEWICVALPGNSLIIENVIDEHGNSILKDIKTGDRFSTPNTRLEEGLSRVVYTPKGLKT